MQDRLGRTLARAGGRDRYRVKAITAAPAAWLICADHLEDAGMIAFVSGGLAQLDIASATTRSPDRTQFSP
jgi:hypothetical protein